MMFPWEAEERTQRAFYDVEVGYWIVHKRIDGDGEIVAYIDETDVFVQYWVLNYGNVRTWTGYDHQDTAWLKEYIDEDLRVLGYEEQHPKLKVLL